MDGRYPEHYYQQHPQELGPIRQRSRIADPHYRTAIDPYVTLTPSERARIRQTDSGEFVEHPLWATVLSHFIFIHLTIMWPICVITFTITLFHNPQSDKYCCMDVIFLLISWLCRTYIHPCPVAVTYIAVFSISYSFNELWHTVSHCPW